MDKEQQLAEARKLLKKFRAKNAKKASQVGKSSPPPAKLKKSSVKAAPPSTVASLTNGLSEHQDQVAGQQQTSNQSVARDSGKQPLNSTPNQKSMTDKSSLPILLNIGQLDFLNAAMPNGSVPNYLAPSPIPKSSHPGGMASGDFLTTPGSKESSPASRTSSSGQGIALKHREEGKDTGHLHGIRELGNSNVKENGKVLPTVTPVRGGIGGAKFGEAFSGASQGGVLVNHMQYLPATGSGAPPKAMARLGTGVRGRGVVEAGDVGYGDDRVTAVRDQLAGRYAMEEEITELEQKIRIHAQTIDILVSEKSSLQSELSSCKSQLSGKSRECMDSDMRVKSMERKLAKLESEASVLNSDLSKRQRELEAVRGEKVELHRSLDRLRSTLDDQREEGTELISKVTAQSAEIVRLQEVNADLQSKLSLKELLLSQQQAGDNPAETVPAVDHALSSRLRECESRADQLQQDLNHAVRQRDQANLDLRITQESLAQLREDNSKKLIESEKALGEYRNQAALLKKEVDKLSADKQVLEKKLSAEHAQMEHSFQSVMETLKEERDQLAKQLENKIHENVDLVKKNTEAETSVLEMSIKMSRLEEQSVDHDNIMKTITQDKEALSRAMSQNKELKSNNMELQEAFVRLSNQNMELATELDSERRRLSQLRAHQAAPAPPEAPPTSEPPNAEVPAESPLTGLSSEVQSLAVGDRSVLVEGGTQTDPVTEDVVDVGGQINPPNAEVQRYTQVLELERSELRVQVESLLADKQLLQEELRQAVVDQSSMRLTGSPTHSPHEALAATETSGKEIREEKEMVSLSTKEEECIGDGVATPSDGVDLRSVMSPLQLTELQTSFDALQMKFVSLMREKADLLDLLEEHKLLLTAATQQAEEFGDRDTSMYQRECETLRHQFAQKDAFIDKLKAEKATMQTDIGQLQVLMRRIVAEQKSTRPRSPTSPTTRTALHHQHHHHHHHLKPESGSVGPFHSSPTVSQEVAIPAHLRPQVFSGDAQLSPDASIADHSEDLDISGGAAAMSDVTSGSDFLGVSDDGSGVTSETTEQIIELLDKLERSGSDGHTSGRRNGTVDFMMYCKTCTGQLQSI